VVALLAVEPDGSTARWHFYTLGGELRGARRDRDVIRVTTAGERLTWLIEGRLSKGVVLGPESEQNEVARLSADVVGLKGQTAIGTDIDVKSGCEGRRDKRSSEEKTREGQHL